jgi:hypothetical protein
LCQCPRSRPLAPARSCPPRRRSCPRPLTLALRSPPSARVRLRSRSCPLCRAATHPRVRSARGRGKNNISPLFSFLQS